MKYLALEKQRESKILKQRTEDIQNYKRTTLGIVNEKRKTL